MEPQIIRRISFASNIVGDVDPDWGRVVGPIGAGMTVNQTGGNLVITAGQTPRSETIIRADDVVTGGVRVRARSTLSGRIADNSFFVELVDVVGDNLAYNIVSATQVDVWLPERFDLSSRNIGQSMTLCGFSGTGTFLSGRYPIAAVNGNVASFTVSGFAVGAGTVSAVGWSFYRLTYDGTTATSAKFDTGRCGYSTGDSSVTINTTASPGHLAVMTGNDTQAAFHDQTVASVSNALTLRSGRVENVPDDQTLRLQVRIANGATAPTADTTWTIGFLAEAQYSAQDVLVQDIRPYTPTFSLPVTLQGTQTTQGNGTQGGAAGNFTPIGGEARTTNPTAVTNGQHVRAQATTIGVLVTRPYAVPDVEWNTSTPAGGITTGADQQIQAAAGVGLRRYVTSATIQNNSATAGLYELKEGVNVIWRMVLPANYPPTTHNFTTPKKTTANAALNHQAATGMIVVGTFDGYTAP